MNKECEHKEICDCCDIDPEDCGYYKPTVDRDALLEIADDLDAIHPWDTEQAVSIMEEMAQLIRKACGVSISNE